MRYTMVALLLGVVLYPMVFSVPIWSQVECVAYDMAERYNFAFIKGLMFKFFSVDVDFSFDLVFCDHIEAMVGNYGLLDMRTSRYSTNVQGIMSEFLIDRRYGVIDGISYDRNDQRTWSSKNVEKFRMLFSHGSQGPPCHREYDRTAGSIEHAPQVGGRTAEVHVYCGGCPGWPTNWTKDVNGVETEPGTEARKEQVKAFCTKFPGRQGLPISVDSTTLQKVDVTDDSACVCGVEQPGGDNCHFKFEVTVTCPEATKAFNPVKRLTALALVVSILGLVGTVTVIIHYRMKAHKNGKTYAMIQRLGGAGKLVQNNLKVLHKIKHVIGGADVIPPPPARN